MRIRQLEEAIEIMKRLWTMEILQRFVKRIMPAFG